MESKCETFSLKKFPFDVQHCDIILDSSFEYHLVSFKVKIKDIPTARQTFLSETDIWTLEDDPTVKHETAELLHKEVFTRIRLQFKFRRNSCYYLATIFAPLFLLTVLQFFALLIPPGAFERASFSVTVVLSFTVLLGNIYQSIPKTSESFYLGMMIVTKLFASSLLTMYMLLTMAKVNIFGIEINNVKTVRKVDKFLGISMTLAIATLDTILTVLMTT